MDLSIAEFGVYGFVTYASILMMIISVVKEVPSSRSLSVMRTLGLIPGLICAGILSVSGVNIDIHTDTTNTSTLVYNSTHALIQNSTASTTTTSKIILQNRAWMMVHMMFFLFLLIFIIYQFLTLMTRTD